MALPRDPSPHTPFSRDELDQSIPERFAWQVAAGPHRLAVKCGADALTYGELDRRADGVARVLLERLGPTPQGVVLLLEQSVWLVAAILGVLKAGKYYVPLDPAHPHARLVQSAEHAEAAAILADPGNEPLASSLATNNRPVIEITSAEPGASGLPPLADLGPDSLAYIFFTSGSTGRPKGVVDNHRNVLHNVMRYTNSLRFGPSDRLSLVQSASFSGTVSSLFGALLNGAAIFPYDLRRQGLGLPLASWLREERITVYHSVPSIFRSFLRGDAGFPDVRVVRLEGDAVAPLDVSLFRRHFASDALLSVGLGATETGLSCQMLIDRDTDLPEHVVPIGRSTTDTSLSIVGDDRAPVPPGEVGELTVSSPFLAVGYWRDAERTAAAFQPGIAGSPRTYFSGDLARLRADGLIEYLGRKDHRLRVRGQALDAVDVEAALATIPGVRVAAAATHGEATGSARLVAYLVMKAAEPLPELARVRAFLAPHLPPHMIPSVIVGLRELPVTDTGKLDRAALPPPPASERRASTRAPRDELEETLCGILGRSLSIEDPGIDEDFHELGGDSLLAASACDQIGRRLGRTVSIDTLLRLGTVERLASAIGEGLGAPSKTAIVPLVAAGRAPAFFFVGVPYAAPGRYALLADRLRPRHPFYSVQPLDAADFATSDLTLETVAERRVRDLRAIQPGGPYFLGGACYGAVVAFEMAGQLARVGETIGLLALCQVTAHDFPSLVSPLARARYRWHRVVGARAKHGVFRARHHVRRLAGRDLAGSAAYLQALVSRALMRRQRDGDALSASARLERRADARAFDSYSAAPFPGDVLLVLTRGETRDYTRWPERAWRNIGQGTIRIELVGGRPLFLFEEPEVDELARILSAALSKAAGF